jgi:Isoprenylcysteine carboxyl methyltransferase (ICMT) family.
MSLYVFAGVTIASFLIQLLSVFVVFKKVDSTGNGRYRFFQVQFLATWGTFFWALFSATPEAHPVMWGSAAVVVACLGLFFYCSTLIRKNKLSIVFSEDSPEFHISKGPYSFVRHPFYTSYIFTYVAVAVGLNNVVFSLMAGSMFVTYFFAARYEEKKFEASKLGASYTNYKASTGMFIPKVRRAGGAAASKKAA